MSDLKRDADSSRGGDRLPYRKPTLGRVRLEADQVLTSGCKTGPAPNSGSAQLCTVAPCNNTIGS